MKRIIFFLVGVLWLVVCVCSQAEAAPSGSEETPQLSVRGEASLQVPADEAQLTLGVVTEADSPQAALAQNNHRMQAVAKALSDAGLKEGEYRTGRFRIEPQWSSPPRQVPPDWKPRITGYGVTNTLQVKTGQLAKVGEIIAAATEAGANTVDTIVFDLADPRGYRAQAIQEATQNAQADAAMLAKAASVRLGKILLLSLGETGVQPVRMQLRAMAPALADGEPPVIPGQITVSATVDIVYEIK